MSVPLRRPAALVVLAGALTLAACSTSGGSSGSAAASAAAEPAYAAAAAGSGGSGAAPRAAKDAGGRATTLDAAAIQPRIVRTAQVVVQADGELAAAAAKVRAVAQSLRGTVSDETTTYAETGDTTPSPAAPATGGTGWDGTAPDGAAGKPATRPARPGESVIVLRVPSADLDRALVLLTGPAGVGKELSRAATAQDVTGDLADLQSRVGTQRASVTRVRALLARAASLQQIVSIESEVTKRESDLEAAEARQAALADRADFATLTVDLRTPEAVPPPPAAEPNSFVQGLAGGWHAITASTAVVLTVLGALLPVAVVLAVLGAPVLWWLRRRHRSVVPVAPAPAADAGV